MTLRNCCPRQVEIAGQQFSKSGNFDACRVSEQLIKYLAAQRPQCFDQLPRFVKRLGFSYVAKQFEYGALGHGNEDVGSPIWKRLQAEPLSQIGIEELRCLVVAVEAFFEPRRQLLRLIAPQGQDFAKCDVLPYASPGKCCLATDVKAGNARAQECQGTVSRERIARQHIDTTGKMSEPATASKRGSSERTHAMGF